MSDSPDAGTGAQTKRTGAERHSSVFREPSLLAGVAGACREWPQRQTCCFTARFAQQAGTGFDDGATQRPHRHEAAHWCPAVPQADTSGGANDTAVTVVTQSSDTAM